MKAATRKVVIAGNWKMYKTALEAVAFIQELLPLLKSVDLPYLAVPFTAIQDSAQAADAKIVIGAQNMNDAAEGAFTGEIAARMLTEAGAKFVILGHSERRRYFHEDNHFINRKLKRAIADQLQPLLCVGETAEERAAEKTAEVIKTQLTECLEGVAPEQIGKMLIAYEPVWAIGTNLSASPEQAQEVQKMGRAFIEENFGKEAAAEIRILYGGSVTPQNIKELMSQPDIDGVLVGGASLNPQVFSQIINYQQV